MSNVLSPQQRKRIVARHKSSLYQHGPGPQALFWQNETVQTQRFDVLLKCGIQTGDTVLDVGCGLADLHHYMKQKNLDVDYTGIDISPDLIEAARLRDSEVNLFIGDVFDFDPAVQSFDWVMLSGALNEPMDDDGEYLYKCLPRLYATARKGLAFNLLNAEYPWTARERCHLQSWLPADVLASLANLTQNISTRTDYLDTDITYFLWRNEIYRPLKI